MVHECSAVVSRSGGSGASPVGLVVRLYGQIVEDLRQAANAIEQADIGGRTKCINHAIVVIGHLQSALDSINGSKVAKDLDHFYNVIRQNLVQVQFYPSKRGLAQQITDWLAVREAWIKVEHAEKPALPPPPVATTPAPAASRAFLYTGYRTRSQPVGMDFRG